MSTPPTSERELLERMLEELQRLRGLIDALVKLEEAAQQGSFASGMSDGE